MSVKVKFILLFVLVTLVPSLYATISNSHRSIDQIVDARTALISSVADLNKEQVDEALYHIAADIEADLLSNPLFLDSNLESIGEYQVEVPDIIGVAYWRDGNIVRLEGDYYTQKRISSNEEISNSISLSHFAADDQGHVVLEFSYASESDSNEHIGFQVSNQSINNLFQDYSKRGASGETYFVAKNVAGDYITVSPLRFLLSAALTVGVNSGDESSPDYYVFNEKLEDRVVYDYRGKEVLFEGRSLALADWGLVTKFDTEEVYLDTSGLVFKNTLNVLIVYLFVLLAISFVINYFLNPIHKILAVVKNASANNFNVKTSIERDDEIGDLSRYIDRLIQTFAKGYSALSNELKEKTRYLESRNVELEDTKKATLSILDDLNDQRDELVISEARDEAIIQGISDGMLILDIHNLITFANEKAVLMLSSQNIKGSLVGKKWVNDFDNLHTESREKVDEKKYQQLSKKGRYSIVVSTSKENLLPIDVSESDMISKDSLIGKIVLFRDISAIRNAEREMKRFQLAVRQVEEHIIITDPKGIIIYANPAVEKITGFKPSEIIGKTPALWGGQMPKEFYAEMWHTIKEEKKEFVGKIKNKRKNGEVYDASARITPVLNDLGEVEFFMGMERDITQEEAVNRAKTEFVSLASHQLRTPLTAINWYLELLSDGSVGKLQKEQKEYIKEISDASERMTRLVNDLLNISRIETGRLTVTPEKVDLDEFLGGIVKEVIPLTKGSKCDVLFMPKVKGCSVLTDSLLARQVIHNFLTNAIKYSRQTEACSVVVGLEEKGEEYVVSVTDSGMGIPAEERDKVFTKFFRSSNARLSETDGTGLGLYTSKMIAETISGRVWFESELGKGSTFYFAIPIKGISGREGEVSLSVIK